jgi:MFS family permease
VRRDFPVTQSISRRHYFEGGGGLLSMAEAPDIEVGRKGRRKASTVGSLLLFVGLAIFGLSRGLLYQLGWTALWLVVLAFVLVSAGIIVALAYSGIGNAAEREADSIFAKSVAVCVALFLLGFVMIFAVVGQLPMEQRGTFFIFSLGMIMAGAMALVAGRIMAEIRRTRFAAPPGITESFHQIKSDKTFETENFTVIRVGDIFVLLSKIGGAVYFVKLFNQMQVQEKAIKLPNMFFRKTQFKDEIGGIPVAKSRGDIMIPIDVIKGPDRQLEEKYVRGTGVSYLIPVYDTQGKRDLSKEFTKTAILNIIRELSTETE